MDGSMWTLKKAVALCVKLETIAPKHGAHVALTGGTLYKDGRRKDCDVLFYRIRQVERIDIEALLDECVLIGLATYRDCGWVVKGTYLDDPIDLFFPERPADEWPAEAAGYEGWAA